MYTLKWISQYQINYTWVDLNVGDVTSEVSAVILTQGNAKLVSLFSMRISQKFWIK